MYNASKPFTKNKERRQKFKETRDLMYIYRSKIYKVQFQHGIAYTYFKDFLIREASEKLLRDNEFNIANYAKYYGCQYGFVSVVYKLKHGLVSMVYKLSVFYKKFLGRTAKSDMSKQNLAEE